MLNLREITIKRGGSVVGRLLIDRVDLTDKGLLAVTQVCLVVTDHSLSILRMVCGPDRYACVQR